MHDYQKLICWKKAYELAGKIHPLCLRFPPEERYALALQLRRAAVSVAVNIAEGCGRGSRPELGRFLSIALGSAFEVECLLFFARDRRYIPPAAVQELLPLVAEVKRLIYSYHRAVMEGP